MGLATASSRWSTDVIMHASDSPEPPRFGIIHLLVGTTCIAVHLAITRAFMGGPAQAASGYDATRWALWSIGAGAALGGLVLLVSRCNRGLRFPVHPGETLLILLGIGSVVGLGFHCYVVLTDYGMWLSTVNFVSSAAIAVLFVLAAIRTKTRRWRYFFLSVVAAFLLRFPLGCAGLGPLAYIIPRTASDLLLLIVVVSDLRQRQRYPWTHWLGAGVGLWYAILLLVWVVHRYAFGAP